MMVLDTNVISEFMRKVPESRVIDWLDTQPAESIWTTAISVYEIRFGLEVLDDGVRKKQLQDIFKTVISHDLSNRVLDFDNTAANEAALISAGGRNTGRSIEIRDALIAGLVRSRRATLVTRNVKHFGNTGITIINPWDFVTSQS